MLDPRGRSYFLFICLHALSLINQPLYFTLYRLSLWSAETLRRVWSVSGWTSSVCLDAAASCSAIARLDLWGELDAAQLQAFSWLRMGIWGERAYAHNHYLSLYSKVKVCATSVWQKCLHFYANSDSLLKRSKPQLTQTACKFLSAGKSPALYTVVSIFTLWHCYRFVFYVMTDNPLGKCMSFFLSDL